MIIVSVFSFGCANPIGRPVLSWEKPAPRATNVTVPKGYKLVPDTAPQSVGGVNVGNRDAVEEFMRNRQYQYTNAPTTTPTNTVSAPVAPTNQSPVAVSGLVAPTNGYVIIKAPGFLSEDKVVSSGKSPYRLRFLNALTHGVTVGVNHDTRKLDIPAGDFKEINADPASTVVLYEVRSGAKLLSAGKVEMNRDEPLTTVVIRSP